MRRNNRKHKASPEQVAANRQNAQKSTGPKTAEGKRRSSQNAMRHGFTGQVFVMTESDRPAYEQMLRGYFEDLQPRGAVETQLVTNAAFVQWRLNKALGIELNWFGRGLAEHEAAGFSFSDHPDLHTAMSEARTFEVKIDKFSNLTLYEQRLQRQMLRYMHEFDARKKDRLLREKTEPLQEQPKAMAAGKAPIPQTLDPVFDTGEQPHEKATGSEKIGFVFSLFPRPAQPAPQPAPETPPAEAEND